jgi:hypothetical protein
VATGLGSWTAVVWRGARCRVGRDADQRS